MAKKKSAWETKRDEDNADRAMVVEETLAAYRLIKDNRRDEDEADFRDLLSDMRHYAKINKLNFDKELNSATRNYNAEI